MPRSVELRIDTQVAKRTSAGVVVAGITLHVDEVTFPAERWTDFAEVVLHVLTEAALSLLRGVSVPIEVRFMEEPYVLELSSVSATRWRVALVEDRLIREIRSIHEFSANELVDDLVAGSERLLSLCRERNWWSTDSDRLQSAVRALHARPRLVP